MSLMTVLFFLWLTDFLAEAFCDVTGDVAVAMATLTMVEAVAADRTLTGCWAGVTPMVAQLRLERVGGAG